MHSFNFLYFEWIDGEITITRFNEEEFKKYAPDGRLVIPKILFGSRVVGIGDEVFANCESIKEVVLQEGLKEIGKRAFAGCVNLTKVKIPNSVETIGGGAFNGIENLSLDQKNECFAIFDKYYLVQTKPLYEYDDRMTLVSYLGNEPRPIIPNIVKCLGDYAFAGADRIVRIDVRANIKELGEGVFQDCKSLKSATLPDTLTTIPKSAFRNCSALETLRCSENLAKIESLAFAGCSSLDKFYI